MEPLSKFSFTINLNTEVTVKAEVSTLHLNNNVGHAYMFIWEVKLLVLEISFDSVIERRHRN